VTIEAIQAVGDARPRGSEQVNPLIDDLDSVASHGGCLRDTGSHQSSPDNQH
jgi:hypothetical protein